MANFIQENRLIPFPPKVLVVDSLINSLSFPFSYHLSSGWVSFLIKVENSNGAMHLQLRRSPSHTEGDSVSPELPQQWDSGVPGLLSRVVWPVCSDIARIGFKLFTIVSVKGFAVNAYPVHNTN